MYFLSAFLHTFIPIKIKLYKRKVAHEDQHDLNEKDSLLDMSINIIFIFLLVIGMALSLKVSKISPFEFDQFLNTLMIFSLNVLFPPFLIFIVCVSYYYRHQDMSTYFVNLIREKFT
jgi:hypothetical protein